MRAAIIAASLSILVGCGGNSGGPVSSISPEVGGSAVGPPSSTPYSPSEGDQSVLPAQLSTGVGSPFAGARSAVGAPVIYSTSGGPYPHAERAGYVQIGANVTPLPDWKRPDRWSDPVNGVSVSTGRTYSGARAARIAEYVTPHIDDKWEPQGYTDEPTVDTPGLASFPSQPVLRLAEGTSDEHAAYALHAAALINSTLPHNKRILIGPEAPPLVSVDQVPNGQIFVDFAAKSDWIPSSEGSAAMTSTSYAWERIPDDTGCLTAVDCAVLEDLRKARDAEREAWDRLKIASMRAAHVWVDPDAVETQVEFVRMLVHEMLHALGLRGHSFVDDFPDSILRNVYSTFLPTDNHVPMIDADGLLAAYARLSPGAGPDSLSADSLTPWENESFRMHGQLDTPEKAAFGAAFRNGLARPWASGPEPFSPIGQNENLRGDVAWNGALLGFAPDGSPIAGEAKLTVDLGSLTGRADFTELEEYSSPKLQDAGYWSTWEDGDLGYNIAVSGNTIRETGGDEGILTASFVGKQHQGIVGILERHDLSAAFGASVDSDSFRDYSDTIEQATDVALGTRFTGTINSLTDIDYFKVRIEGPGRLTITSTDDSLRVRVLDSDSVEIPSRPGSVIADITEDVYERLKEKAQDSRIVNAFIAVGAKTKEAVGKIYRGAVSYLPKDEVPPEPPLEPPPHLNARDLSTLREWAPHWSEKVLVGFTPVDGGYVSLSGGWPGDRGPSTDVPLVYRNVAHHLRYATETFPKQQGVVNDPELVGEFPVTGVSQATSYAYWGNWAAAEMVLTRVDLSGGTVHAPRQPDGIDLPASASYLPMAFVYGNPSDPPEISAGLSAT